MVSPQASSTRPSGWTSIASSLNSSAGRSASRSAASPSPSRWAASSNPKTSSARPSSSPPPTRTTSPSRPSTSTAATGQDEAIESSHARDWTPGGHVATNEKTGQAIERLWAEIERREDEIIETVSELVRRPSPLGAEAEAQGYVADHLRATGLNVDVWDLDEALKDLPNAGNSGVPFAGRPNVAGVLAGSSNGRSLILNGHIDVVSPEPVSAWTHDPWQATIVGDRMYGRGAHDMKSGDALNLMLPRLLRNLGIQLGGDLIIQSVIEEECTGNGALDAARRYQADACVVTEPSGGEFTHAHVGVVWFRVGITGESAHAAVAWKGVNAITRSIPIMQALQALDARLNEQTHPAFAGIPHPINLNVGVVHGGD